MLVVCVSLICHNNNFFARLAKHVGDAVIEVCDSVADIDKKEDYISFLNGDFDLLVDFILKDVLRVDHPAAGIDQRKLTSIPYTVTILAVARGSCGVAHDGSTTLRQAIEKGRFSHIGPTHDCY